MPIDPKIKSLKGFNLRRTQSGRKDVWTLFDTSRAHASTLDDYLQVVLERSAEWLKASGASIFLLSEGANEYFLAAKAGQEVSAPDDAKIVPGEGIAGAAIESKSPILIDDSRDHPALRQTGQRRNRKWGSSLVVPLLTPDQDCIGVLNLSRTREEIGFSKDDLRSAKSLAGHIALAVANGRLLSKLRLALEDTSKTNRKLDTILSSIAIGIVVLTPHGTISHINPEATALVQGSDLPDSKFDDFVESAPLTMRSGLREVAAKGSSGVRTSVVVRDDSDGRAYTLTASPHPGGGATIAIQDTTEHENAMQEFSRMHRLAEIGQMTAAIAHEIRNPLWAMRAAAQVLQTDPTVASEFGKIIEDEVVKLSELCNGFLDFARPLELNLQPAKIGDVVESIAEQHQPQFADKNIELQISIAQDEPTVFVDPLRVEQVVRNLLINALDACESGGHVEISYRKGRIVVQDSGRGVEQASMEKLFVPFFSTKANGTGLGLSTVRKIVDAHGGEIWVESEPGQGARFTVDLRGLAA